MVLDMETAPSPANIVPPSIPKSPKTVSLTLFIGLVIVFLILGLVGGFVGSSLVAKAPGAGGGTTKYSKNAVFDESYRYVTGKVSAKDGDKLTIEKDGSRLTITFANPDNSFVKEATQAAAGIRPVGIAEVPVGAAVRGGVLLSPEFIAGDTSGKVTGVGFTFKD